VYQRPNHLMVRAARGRRVYFVEEPRHDGASSRVESHRVDGLTVVRPVLPEGTTGEDEPRLLRQLLNRFLADAGIHDPWLWYYTPMALRWTAHVRASAVVYDCMDELSNFKFAPAHLRELERELMQRADLVFTGGRSLYEAKRDRHESTFLFASSVDAAHFRGARAQITEPADQAAIGRPRIGYYGVIDERLDLELIDSIAQARPEWNLVMVGPVTKIRDEDLPRAANIHWLGLKSYDELPAYLAGWDVAIMPFALNDSTRYISPTKTPEYLAGGRPVVSTPITDVVRPYGDQNLVHIAADAETFVDAIQSALDCDRIDLVARADSFLATQSWDATWAAMEALVSQVRPHRSAAADRELQVPAFPGPALATTTLPRPALQRRGADAASSVAVSAAATRTR
jgi:UDP-galactopyranose mutase